MRALILAFVLVLPAVAQRPVTPPAGRAGTASIGHVSLGMDAFGRERLCERLGEVFAMSARSIHIDTEIKAACEGGPRNQLSLTSTAFDSPEKAQRLACGLLRTPLGFFAPKLEMVWIRRTEPPKAWDDLAGSLDGLGVRDLGRFLDAAGFDRLTMRTDGETEPVLTKRVYELNAACS